MMWGTGEAAALARMQLLTREELQSMELTAERHESGQSSTYGLWGGIPETVVHAVGPS